jgi:hypothetical protein
MAFVPPKDRVLETSTTSGTGPYALAGAVDTSFNRFSASMSVGDTTFGAIVEPGVAFLSGILTYSAANQITATTVSESKGTFGAGTKEIFMGLPANKALSLASVGTTAGTVAAGDDARISGAVRSDASQTLSATQKAQAQANVYLPPTTQVLTSGSTYTTPAGVKWLEVLLVGAGGGGGGGGGGNLGSVGGNTTFGALSAGGGGGGGTTNGPGGSGGTAAGGYLNIAGSTGTNGIGPAATSASKGGDGGASCLGGAGTGGTGSAGPRPGAPSSGSGGGGGVGSSSFLSAGGGGAGGSVRAIITYTASTYAYSIGAAGAAGAIGAGTQSGAAGADGVIIVVEHYGS